MALLSMLDVHLAFGGPPLLDGVNLQIETGERVCLVGRNGAGKSTLFRIAAGVSRPDSGEIGRSARQGILTQEIPDDLHGTVREVVASIGFVLIRIDFVGSEFPTKLVLVFSGVCGGWLLLP
jgi:ATP-binding cassette subfamily F protein uup